MKKNHYFSLEKWIEIADDAYNESKELKYKKLSTKKPLNIPAYLLHWSIEIYLKAFLMQNNQHFPKSTKGHNLNFLFKECLKIDPKIIHLSKYNDAEKEDQLFWIDTINDYGKNGGLRYLNKNRESWSFYVLIHDKLDSLVSYIKNNTKKETDITKYL